MIKVVVLVAHLVAPGMVGDYEKVFTQAGGCESFKTFLLSEGLADKASCRPRQIRVPARARARR